MLDGIENILIFLEKAAFDCFEINKIYEGSAETIVISSLKKKLIITPHSKKVRKIIVDCENDKVIAISFIGSLSIAAADIISTYGQPKESYSFRDELYFYSFEMLRGAYKYLIYFYEPSHKKFDFSSDESIQNINIQILNYPIAGARLSRVPQSLQTKNPAEAGFLYGLV